MPPATIALVRSSIAPMLAEPRVSAAQGSQALFGHAVLVLGQEGEWQRVRTLHDGYEGWTHAGYLERLEVPDLPDAPEAFGPYEARRWSLPAAADDPLDVRAAFGGAASALSLGCRVEAGGRSVEAPFGALVHAAQQVIEGYTVGLDVRAEHYPATAAAVFDTAWTHFRGRAYQWGGVTPWGADCSGFVQAVFGLHGVALPRDAWQQAQVGAAVTATPDALDALAPGDLLFFSDRPDARPTHVALVERGTRIVHLALGRGGWAEDDLAEADDPYVARLRAQVVGARRVL